MKRSAKSLGSRADGSDRPVQTASIYAPKVLSLQGEYLLCDANRSQKKASYSHILHAFLRLADAEPEEILKFAKKWGAFNVETKSIPGLLFLEPISAWRARAKYFGALHRIGADLNQKRAGAAEDWAILGLEAPVTKPIIDEARFLLMERMRRVIRDSQLRPTMYWNKFSEQWQIEFGALLASNLFAVLVLQLMLEIANKDGFAICSDCHRSYLPGRRPSFGRRNYCESCRIAGIPYRDSKREQRRRKREGDEKDVGTDSVERQENLRSLQHPTQPRR